jgi:hypothetical protein
MLYSKKPLVDRFVTPLTPYVICNHYISTELFKVHWKYVDYTIDINANNLLVNQNYNAVRDLDIVQVQIDHFDFFYEMVLPVFVRNNIRIILITSQWHLPQISRNAKTDSLLSHPNILLWISQNPIYTQNAKYMALPYGFLHHSLEKYVQFIQSRDHVDTSNKNTRILNQFVSTHRHLPNNHIRKTVDLFGKNSGSPLSYTDYLTNISHAEFVISTPGDREDCYRHYECIGLDAIPVSNIGGGYKDIFGENMVYSTPEEMVNMVQNNVVPYEYIAPNKDILTVPYWVFKMNQRIELLRRSPSA